MLFVTTSPHWLLKQWNLSFICCNPNRTKYINNNNKLFKLMELYNTTELRDPKLNASEEVNT